jgi:hypothetical protein
MSVTMPLGNSDTRYAMLDAGAYAAGVYLFNRNPRSEFDVTL